MADEIKYPFELLPAEIKKWLISDDATELVSRINRECMLEGGKARAVATLITWIAIDAVAPEDTANELIASFGLEPAQAQIVAKEIQQKIFLPIKPLMRAKLGIDIEKITTGPLAAPVAGPAAQITKLAKPFVADIRKPEQVAKPQAAMPQAKPVAPTNTAKKGEINTQFGFVEVMPTPPPGFKEESLAPPATAMQTAKPPAQPAQHQAAQPSVAQQAPGQPEQAPNDVVPYKDEHPLDPKS